MSLLQRGKVIYSTTSLSIPVELKEEAQALGLNMTEVFCRALEGEVTRRKGEART